MAITSHRNFEAPAIRELNQLHDIFNRAGLEHGEGQPMHDVSKVVCGRLPRIIIEEECPAKVLKIVAKQLSGG
jgi:hypothetical protein